MDHHWLADCAGPENADRRVRGWRRDPRVDGLGDECHCSRMVRVRSELDRRRAGGMSVSRRGGEWVGERWMRGEGRGRESR